MATAAILKIEVITISQQEAQLLLGCPTVLPHNVNPNPKPIIN